MAKKVDINKLSKVKDTLSFLGKSKSMDYAPLKQKFQKKMRDADKMEIETEINLAPMAYEEGSNSNRAARIMKEVEKRRGMIRKLRANK